MSRKQPSKGKLENNQFQRIPKIPSELYVVKLGKSEGRDHVTLLNKDFSWPLKRVWRFFVA